MCDYSFFLFRLKQYDGSLVTGAVTPLFFRRSNEIPRVRQFPTSAILAPAYAGEADRP